MEILNNEISPPLLVSLIVGIFSVLYMVFSYLSKNSGTDEETQEGETVSESSNNKKTLKTSKRNANSNIKGSKKVFTHHRLLTTLKGHAGNVLGVDFSINGKYMVSASDDRSLRFWSVKDFGSGNKCIRVNVELDHAKLVRFSPDSRAIIAGLAQANTIRVFKLSKNEGVFACTPLEKDFPGDFKQDLLSIGIGTTSEGGSFVMTAYKNTSITVSDLRGEVLYNINTNLGENNYAIVSPCGRFIAASGWAPDVKIWEVCFTRTGDFKQVNRAFDLKGHKSSVWSFAFNNDSSRHVHIFHNVLGYEEVITELEEKIRVLPDSVNRQRLKARSNELKKSLDAINAANGDKSN